MFNRPPINLLKRHDFSGFLMINRNFRSFKNDPYIKIDDSLKK